MSIFKLYYFNGRGRGEISRLILIAAGQEFEDIRYSEEEWPSHKSEMPLGQIPVLEVDGIKLPQSMTIARYLAKRFNLAGKDILEQAKVEAVADSATDLLNKIGPIVWYQEEPNKSVMLKTFFAEELPKHLKNLETLAKVYSTESSFFVGDQLTWADLYVYDVLENIVQIDGNVLDQYSWLKRNRQATEQQPNIITYLKNRPSTPF